jgi:hypothetical protein
MPQLQVSQPYASGTPPVWGGLGTSLSDMFTSVKNLIPFTSPTEPASEGIYTDFLGNPYASNQVLSGTEQAAQQDRIDTIAVKDPSGQSGDGCAWYNLPCKAAAKVSAVTSSAGEFISSTLTKVLVITIVVGVGALFMMSYISAKGTQLAK